jgi:sigma-54 dependent transcriptional regulator, acetoin dehydrogenase operon transcriptional activator AcoR
MLALRTSETLTLAEFNEEWLTVRAAEPQVPGQTMSTDADGESVLSDAEREALRRTLESCHWNVSAAAARLHISRRTIYRKIHRHGLLRDAQHLAVSTQEPESGA